MESCRLYHILFKLTFVVPTPTITITPSGPIQGAMVGSPQDIQCTAGTVDGVEFSTVLISWTGSGGDTITNDNRVTISPTTSSGNDYISTLQFSYLMEGDWMQQHQKLYKFKTLLVCILLHK